MLLHPLKTSKVEVRSYGSSKNNDKQTNKFISDLVRLKRLGAVGVKQSFEDEGASREDIRKMRAMTSAANLDLNVKVGGCEARNDISFCKKIGVNGIVAPMVESKYALKKFIQTVTDYEILVTDKQIKKRIVDQKKNLLYINLETNLAFNNIDEIMNSANFKLLDGIVIGRSDLVGSFGLTKDHVDSKRAFKKVFNLLKKIKKKKKKNFICKMGGSITTNSKTFINKLFENKLLDRIETRNMEILLNKKNIANFKTILIHAFNFELGWAKYKLKDSILNKSKLMIKENSSRIKILKKRIGIMSKN